LAEGEELGSNLLHVGQSTPANSCVRSSWQRRGQGRHEPEAPQPPVSNLHHPFWVKTQWRNASHPQVTSAPCPLCPQHQTFAAELLKVRFVPGTDLATQRHPVCSRDPKLILANALRK